MKHFSMIRSFHLADLFTLANAGCGVACIFTTIGYVASHERAQFLWAAALLPIALVFDVLDGRIARWRQRHSPLGRELDSLADVISFGVAPAALAFAAGMNTTLDRAVLIYFVACGVSRLARYNVTAEELSTGAGKVKYYEGTPIPTSVLLVGVLALAAWRGQMHDQLWFGQLALAGGFHPLVLMFAVSGSFMISKTIHIPKL